MSCGDAETRRWGDAEIKRRPVAAAHPVSAKCDTGVSPVSGSIFAEDQRSDSYQPGATPQENWKVESGLNARAIPGAMRWFRPSALDISKSKTWGDAPGCYGVAPVALCASNYITG